MKEGCRTKQFMCLGPVFYEENPGRNGLAQSPAVSSTREEYHRLDEPCTEVHSTARRPPNDDIETPKQPKIGRQDKSPQALLP
jgi:hypothetical protein